MENFAQLEYVMSLLIVSIILTIGLALIGIKIAPEIGLMDFPGSEDHKQHQNAVPMVGGVVILDTFILIILFTDMWRDISILAILISALIIGIFGLLDDFIHLDVTKKLLGQILGGIVLIYLGVQINFFESSEFLFRLGHPWESWMNILFTLLWVVTITNAYNFIDSMDGLAVGLSGVPAAFFLIISLVAGQSELIFISTIILGICIALYFFNSRPATLFLGDSGAQTLGFILASAAIIYEPRIGSQGSSWFVPILIFFVPLFDMLMVIISRLKRGKKIHKASRDHTYHRLFQRGISIHHSILIMHGTSLIISIVGFLCLNLPVNYANIVFGLIIILGIVAYYELDRSYS